MTKLLSGIVLSAFLAAPAMAADLPARVPVRPAPAIVVADYNWSGFYIGLHGGYGWGDSDVNFPNSVLGTFSQDRDGWVGGFHLGIQRQFGRFVLGVEGAASLTGLEGSVTCGAPAICNSDIDHFWRVGARAGMAVGATGNWLVYATGGYARAKLDSNITFGGVETSQDSVHHSGWYAGGGVEYGVTPNFVIGLEAFWVSLDSQRHFVSTSGAIVPGFTRDIDLEFGVVQARATYKFGWWN